MRNYAVMIEEAGGRCSIAAQNLTKDEALLVTRKFAEADMHEMGIDVSEIEPLRDGALLAPGGIYSVINQRADDKAATCS